MQEKQKGMAMIIVLFFAFILGIALAMLVRTNSMVISQNKASLRQLQAYYLACSGINHALMKIRLLPLETYKELKKNGSSAFSDIDSSCQAELMISGSGEKKYDLFSPENCSDQNTPFRGGYRIEKISLDGSHEGKSFAQDSYHLEVSSEVYPFSADDSGKTKDLISEDIIISRFSSSEG
ncbi:MAG: hypothetical protein HQM10_00770 [Candidatus Riflebacteria bacterium]|nr:hypothetical protein [Candidatus Riflebacteria bacterium]